MIKRVKIIADLVTLHRQQNAHEDEHQLWRPQLPMSVYQQHLPNRAPKYSIQANYFYIHTIYRDNIRVKNINKDARATHETLPSTKF